MKINNQVISLFYSNFFIKENDIVFLVFEICSKLNYKKLIDSYAKQGRPPTLPLNVMFMVVVYAYIKKILGLHIRTQQQTQDMRAKKTLCIWLKTSKTVTSSHRTTNRPRKTKRRNTNTQNTILSTTVAE